MLASKKQRDKPIPYVAAALGVPSKCPMMDFFAKH